MDKVLKPRQQRCTQLADLAAAAAKSRKITERLSGATARQRALGYVQTHAPQLAGAFLAWCEEREKLGAPAGGVLPLTRAATVYVHADGRVDITLF